MAGTSIVITGILNKVFGLTTVVVVGVREKHVTGPSAHRLLLTNAM